MGCMDEAGQSRYNCLWRTVRTTESHRQVRYVADLLFTLYIVYIIHLCICIYVVSYIRLHRTVFHVQHILAI